MQRDMVTRRHARKLNKQINALEKLLAAAGTTNADLNTKIERMGEDIGRANGRELRALNVAQIALNGLEAVAAAAHPRVASTLLAIARDGRQQLRGAADTTTNGAHA